MRNVTDHIQTGDAFGLEEIDGIGIFFIEHCRENIACVHLFLFGTVNVHDGPLDGSLDSHGLDRVLVDPVGELLHSFGEILFEAGFQLLEIGAAVIKDTPSGHVVEDGVEDMLQGEVFVAPLLWLL